jgi:DNA-directed RNA polymerase I subunit RPA2
MISKLYALVNGQCAEDNPDALTHQEALLPGHLLLKFMREQLEVCLDMIKDQVRRDHETGATQVNLHDEVYGRRLLDRWPDVGQKFEYLLNTGNMVSRSGLDLSQATGFTVVAEKLNFYRYVLCHCRCRFHHHCGRCGRCGRDKSPPRVRGSRLVMILSFV